MRVVVVGAGIAGLAAAHEVRSLGAEVVVLEATDRPGGKIRAADVAGVTLDVGAEAMVNRRPEGTGLARELGLDLVHPTVASSRVWTRGALRPLPRTLLGAPLDLEQLGASGILSPEGLARARHREPADLDTDLPVGELVGRWYGDEVVDRLVEPLLGGVYAGHARSISTRAGAPQLLDLARRDFQAPPDPGTPVFAATAGGMHELVGRLAEQVEVRTGVTVTSLERSGTGWLVAGERADAVVLATPAAPTARLLADLAPAASAELAAIEYASPVVVTFAFGRDDLPDAVREASGFLVPPVDGRQVKAATFTSSKWGRVDELTYLRTSLGRAGEERSVQRGDDELVAVSLTDLRAAVGPTGEPVATHVQRWGGGLPQYAVGHLDRVARIEADLPPGVRLCGAAYSGVGIAACIGSGRAAAASALLAQ